MSNKTRTEAEESFFVYVRDSNTNKIQRMAFPSDVQVGTSGNPKELQLLGALSLSAIEYQTSTKNNTIKLSDHDTICNVNLSQGVQNNEAYVLLPSQPRDGQLHCIKDSSGLSSTYEIKIKSSVPNTYIDDVLQFSINNDFDSVILYWKDTKWHVLMKVSAGGGGGGAPTDATYLTLSNNSTLTNERVLTVASNLTLTDNGPNNTAQLNLTSILGGGAGTYTYTTVTADAFGRITAISSGTPPPGSTATYLTLSTDAGLANERTLSVSGSNLALTDNGPNNTAQLNLTSILGAGAGTFSNATVTADAFGRITAVSAGTPGAPVGATYVVISNDGTLTNERALVAGLGLLLVDAGANSNVTLSVNNNVVATITGSTFTGPVIATTGLSGSLQQLSSNISYLVAGDNINIISQSNGQVVISSTATGSSGGGDGADPGASYIVVANTASLPNERALKAGYGLELSDGGANGDIIISFQGSLSSSGGSGGADPEASYIVVGNTASLPNERALTAGYGISLNDGGPNGNLIISFDGSLAVSNTGSCECAPSELVVTASYNEIHDLSLISALSGSGTITSSSFDGTTGIIIRCLNEQKIVGIKTFVNSPSSRSIRVNVWDSNNVNVAAAEEIIPPITGVITILFGTASYVVPKEQYNKPLHVTTYYPDLGGYTFSNNGFVVQANNQFIYRPNVIVENIRRFRNGFGVPNDLALNAAYMVEPVFEKDLYFTGSATACLQGSKSSKYYGFTTASVWWNETGSWTPYLEALDNHFSESIAEGITQSGSIFTIANSGSYNFHANFNAYGNDAYITLRLSGSNGTVLQRSTYRATPTDQSPVSLNGIFSSENNDEFKLEYITSGTTYPWVPPLLPLSEPSRTGEIFIHSLASTNIFSDGLSSANDQFFSSSISGSIFTTGSVAFVGDESITSPSQKGLDTFFYVSGTIGISTASNPENAKVALFGGDVRISGSLTVGSGSVKITSNDIQFSNGSTLFESASNLKTNTNIFANRFLEDLDEPPFASSLVGAWHWSRNVVVSKAISASGTVSHVDSWRTFAGPKITLFPTGSGQIQLLQDRIYFSGQSAGSRFLGAIPITAPYAGITLAANYENSVYQTNSNLIVLFDTRFSTGKSSMSIRGCQPSENYPILQVYSDTDVFATRNVSGFVNPSSMAGPTIVSSQSGSVYNIVAWNKFTLREWTGTDTVTAMNSSGPGEQRIAVGGSGGNAEEIYIKSILIYNCGFSMSDCRTIERYIRSLP
jgi:hypothetical protein